MKNTQLRSWLSGGRIARALKYRPIATVLVVALCWTSLQGYSYASAPGRIEAAVQQSVSANEAEDVAVNLSFVPEEFHLRALQEFGIVGAVDGKSIAMKAVEPDGIRSISRLYWVDRIESTNTQPHHSTNEKDDAQ